MQALAIFVCFTGSMTVPKQLLPIVDIPELNFGPTHAGIVFPVQICDGSSYRRHYLG